GEAMAIGRSFPEALQKALRSLEQRSAPLSWASLPGDRAKLIARCAVPHDGRISTLHQALRAGATVAELAATSAIDPWFIEQVNGMENFGKSIARARFSLPQADLVAAKSLGFSDAQLSQLTGLTAEQIRTWRHELGVRPVYHTVDTCAAEFAATT